MRSVFFPFPNESSFCLGHWYWTRGVQNSLQSFKDLIGIVGHTDFNPDDIRQTKWDKINQILGDNVEEGQEGEWVDDDAGWKTTLVKIQVPFHKCMQSTGMHEYMAANLHHHSLVGVIKEHITDPHMASQFQMEPYKLLWQPREDCPEVRLHSEIYTSDTFLEEHQTLQNSPREPGCNLPCVIIGCMIYSDQTHLTAFRDNHFWPTYLSFGNHTKYCRCKPSCNLCSHIAYFEMVHLFTPHCIVCWPPIKQQLSPEFKAFVSKHVGGRGTKQSLFAHCWHELFHTQLDVLFDDEFVEAYMHGIVIMCCDGVVRRFYPHLFTYSGDYPEKWIYALIRISTWLTSLFIESCLQL